LKSRLSTAVFLALLLLITTLSAFADDVRFDTYALQNGGGTSVPLGPGLDPLLLSDPWDSSTVVLAFVTYYGPVMNVTHSYSLDLPSLHLTQGPWTDSCNDSGGCEFGLLTLWWVPRAYQETPGEYSVTANGSTDTYAFRYVSTVPEPDTLIMWGSGLVGLAGVARRRLML
jgi:PEP-CTERM motif